MAPNLRKRKPPITAKTNWGQLAQSERMQKERPFGPVGDGGPNIATSITIDRLMYDSNKLSFSINPITTRRIAITPNSSKPLMKGRLLGRRFANSKPTAKMFAIGRTTKQSKKRELLPGLDTARIAPKLSPAMAMISMIKAIRKRGDFREAS